VPKRETLTKSDPYIHIPIAGLSALAVGITPLAVLIGTLPFAPLVISSGLALAVLLALVFLHRRAHTLQQNATRSEQDHRQQRAETQSLQERLAELERLVESQRERNRQTVDEGRLALEQARSNTAVALTQVVTMRDPITGTHLERLAEYVAVLVAQLARKPRDRGMLTDEVQRCLPGASMLHDIGKVGIPDAILQKPARLTPEEFAVIQRHPTIGGRTLERLCRLDPQDVFLHLAHEIALHHHERWDGSGYPFSLAQERIPLAARIVALADVYDALTSERPYKRAYSHEVTRGLIIAQSRSHFDPLVVEAFLEREVDFMRIRETHAEVSGAVNARRLAPVPARQENDEAAETDTARTPDLRVVSGSAS
jgi:response regulator RpfG family c-di-GMP phosphodiesterase